VYYSGLKVLITSSEENVCSREEEIGMSRIASCLAALALLALSAVAAPIVNAPNVGAFTTFQDLATGRVWLDLNNFFNASYVDMRSSVEAAGFTIAARADVEQLLNTLPLTGGEWSTYSTVMGAAPNRNLFWGAYLSPITLSYAYAYDTDSAWSFHDDSGALLNSIPNAGTPAADMNMWAYQVGEIVVPEPSSMMLVGLGFAALAARRFNWRPR
jgi:hypothetical protein